jgi:ubiquinone/menaquinone biosynthesis C-methylase UbiE
MASGSSSSRDTVDVFDADVARNRGYIYTTNASLSSRLANERITVASLAHVDLRGKRVIDIGCGDGTYSAEWAGRGAPARAVAVDPSAEAIRVAGERFASNGIEFAVHSAYELPWQADAFDIACIRCALHHMEEPVEALREALRVAPLVLVIEPNGYNPVLKVLEKISPYHVQHEERSYAPRTLDRWLQELGATIIEREWIGLVPMFCPDWFARSMKILEPLIETLPAVSRLCCAQYVIVAHRN